MPNPDPALVPADGRQADRRAWRSLVAEALGVFFLVFMAAGADALSVVSGGAVGPVARAIAPALTIGALIYAIADASGAHFNPAVTLAFVLRREFPIAWAIPYGLAQLIGALAAAGLLRGLFGAAALAGVSTPHVADGTALPLEIVLSWLVVTVILGTADRARIVGPNAALAVGATIAACGLIGLPIEGASMNPARSFGPALVEGRLGDLWIYVLGPLGGAVLAVLSATVIHGPAARDGAAREAARGAPER
jgi:aquaporin Z